LLEVRSVSPRWPRSYGERRARQILAPCPSLETLNYFFSLLAFIPTSSEVGP
jgi:hypothetical protein